MCDTMIRAIEGGYIFGKNSDRSPNEPNLTVFFPAKKTTETVLKCTYIEIPQVSYTHAIVLVKPSWMWGGEMGINDQGVFIGNEAVFTTSKGKKTERLLGMDLIRLALERCSSASDALNTIIELIKKHGQGGNCGFDKPFYYDNSFLIADAKHRFILETSGTAWTKQEIGQSGNISNRLSLHLEDMSQSEPVLDFAKTHTEPLFTHFSGSKNRQCAASALLQTSPFDVHSMMSILKTHDLRDEASLYQKGSVRSVCMHKSLLGDHTTSSMIIHHRKAITTLWLTGCSTPCLSIYKPTYFGLELPPVFDNQEEALTYWLDREYLVRAIYAGLIDQKDYQSQLHLIQDQLVEDEAILQALNPDVDHIVAFVKYASELESDFVEKYRPQIEMIRMNSSLLPKLWVKKTQKLGHHVFESDLKSRVAR